jgi:cystathionine beta-lyase/cystathionine gamma-synthase
VTAGAMCCSREFVDRAWEHARAHGPVLHPFEVWLLRRSLKTYGLRMEGHKLNAMEVARFLEDHPAVEKVRFPGLKYHPQHEVAKRQMIGGFGGMLSFKLKGGYEAAHRAIRCTQMCILAMSLGGVETFITHPAFLVNLHNTDEERRAAGVSPELIGMSVGAEDIEDIIGVLDTALV